MSNSSYTQRKKQIEIHFESNFTSQEVWLDRNKMDSIIRNLMTNALKYTQQGGSIKIQTSKSKSHWFLFITDTGIGISSNDQKKNVQGTVQREKCH